MHQVSQVSVHVCTFISSLQSCISTDRVPLLLVVHFLAFLISPYLMSCGPVAQVDPEMRVRFTSPHPKDFPDEVS